MIKLIRFEIHKVFGRHVIWLILLVFLILNAMNIERHHHIFKTDRMEQGRYELYQELCGEMTEEKIARIQENYNAALDILNGGNYDTEYNPERYYSGYAYGDANLWREVKEEYDRIQGYESEMTALTDSAKRMNENSALSEYYRRQNEQIINIYERRSLQQFSRLEGVTALSEYRLSSVLLIMLLILTAGNMYVIERENGMAEMICTARNGGMKTATAKLFASLLITAFFCILFYGMDIALFMYFYRIDGLNQFIYAVPSLNGILGFAHTPLCCTVWQYFLLIVAIRLLGFCVIASVFMFFSALMRSAVFVFFSAVLFTASMMLCYTFWNTGAGIVLNYCNPLRLLLIDFKEYEVCNFAEYPVSISMIAVFTGIAVFFLNSILYLIAGRKRV